MKGGVASMLLATEVLRALEVPLAGDLIVNTVTDEESTGAGSLAVAASGLRADAGIIPEPTRLSAWLGTRGSLHAADRGRRARRARRLSARPLERGRAGQRDREGAARARGPAAPAGGVAAAPGHAARGARAGEHRPDRARGRPVDGLLPGRRDAECHVQYVPAQADADGCGTRVEAEIEARVLAAAQADPWLAAHPPRSRGRGDVPPGFDRPGRARRRRHARRDGRPRPAAHRRVAARPSSTARPSRARASRRSRFGPGDILHAHAVDEHVPVDELVRAAQVLAVAAMRFCGLAGAPDGTAVPGR